MLASERAQNRLQKYTRQVVMKSNEAGSRHAGVNDPHQESLNSRRTCGGSVVMDIYSGYTFRGLRGREESREGNISHKLMNVGSISGETNRREGGGGASRKTSPSLILSLKRSRENVIKRRGGLPIYNETRQLCVCSRVKEIRREQGIKSREEEVGVLWPVRGAVNVFLSVLYTCVYLCIFCASE